MDVFAQLFHIVFPKVIQIDAKRLNKKSGKGPNARIVGKAGKRIFIRDDFLLFQGDHGKLFVLFETFAAEDSHPRFPSQLDWVC